MNQRFFKEKIRQRPPPAAVAGRGGGRQKDGFYDGRQFFLGLSGTWRFFIGAAEERPVCPVRFGTPQERALSGQLADPARRAEVEELLTQLESFAALTGAVQHDVDVWTERISQVLAGL